MRRAGPDIGGDLNLVWFIKAASGYCTQVGPSFERKANRSATDGTEQDMNALTAFVRCMFKGFDLAVVELNSVDRENGFRVERCASHLLAEGAVTRKSSQWHLVRAKADISAKATARE